MSNWKVSKEKIEIFPHSNADALMIGKVGSYQVVVQKGLYVDGDEIVFAPEKSILSGDIKTEFEKYLVGPNKDRVKAVRLRGEISSGIIIPKHLLPNLEQFEIGEDIHEFLGIEHYEPPIPTQLAGKVKTFNMPHIGQHDCEHVGVYVNELAQGERVVISEKIHGCCDENTMIKTKNGSKTIKQICDEKTNDEILSFDVNTGQITYDRIIGHKVSKNIDNWHLIELEDGTKIKLTDNHPIFLPDYMCYRRVSELKVGDFVLKS